MIRLVALAMSAFALAAIAPLSAQTPPSERDLRIYAGLHAAAAEGNVAEIERLVAAGERPNIQDSGSRTPLHVAAYRKHHEAVRALLRLGANPNALDLESYDILTIAAVQNNTELLKIALEGGTSVRNVTTPYDGSALGAAAHRGHAEVVRLLIEHQAPLDHVNRMGWTPLLQAVVLGNGGPNYIATVETLVKAGANTEVADRNGATALDHARGRGYGDIVKILEPLRGRRT